MLILSSKMRNAYAALADEESRFVYEKRLELFRSEKADKAWDSKSPGIDDPAVFEMIRGSVEFALRKVNAGLKEYGNGLVACICDNRDPTKKYGNLFLWGGATTVASSSRC